MDAGDPYYRRTVEEVFRDLKARKAGMIKALTTDFQEFYKQCDPANKETLCLFGYPSKQWEVRMPDEMVPPELPEPALGINFARDRMPKIGWLCLVALYSDAWLFAVAFYFGARFQFDKADRKCLFNMINDHPSLFEVVTCKTEKKSSSSVRLQSKYGHDGEKSEEDMDGVHLRSVKEIFRDFKGRRAGLLKAFTTDAEEFYQLCDPEKKNLCLYGFPSEKWEVNMPAVELPTLVPEPALGINFARDGMRKIDWLTLVAVHSDAWLLSVAYFFGAQLDQDDRECLFDMINDLPTLFDVFQSSAQKELKENSSNINHGINESKSNLKEDSESRGKDGEAVQMHSKKEAKASFEDGYLEEDLESQVKDAEVMQMQPEKETKESFEDEYLEEYGGTMCGGCGLYWSFTGSIFGRWQIVIGNGCDPCPERKM